jgi:histidinol-phosphate aminotransferase
MVDIERLVRVNIKQMSPYASARDEYSGKDGIFLDANENALGSVGNDRLNRYPDPRQRQVKEHIARLRNVKPRQIFLGNGSDEAIDLMMRAFCEPARDKILILPPTYGMYEVCAAMNDVGVVRVNLTAEFEIDLPNVLDRLTEDNAIKLIYICSPNNPTGNAFRQEDIREIIKKIQGLVVIDEAYIDFSRKASWLRVLAAFNNLVVLHTFSKVWGLAGIRLGAAFADEAVIKILDKIKYPYNVNEMTQRVALHALDHVEQRDNMVDTILAQRDLLMQRLNTLTVVEKIFPSDANFLLVRFNRARDVFEYLLDKKIIIRDRSSAPQCSDCLRITVGTAEENEQLITALKEYEKNKIE